MLRHSHEFADLPSDRNTASSAAKVMLRLMGNAAAFGSFGYSTLSHRAKRSQQRLQLAIARGEEIELNFETRPGAFVERQPEEVRAVLRTLVASDLNEILIDPNLVHDWGMSPKPGQRGKFGENADVYESLPRIFTMSTSTT